MKFDIVSLKCGKVVGTKRTQVACHVTLDMDTEISHVVETQDDVDVGHR